MTPQEQETLRISTERDIDQIMRACWPREWSSEPADGEPKMAIGCIHPVRLLQLDQLTGKVYCRTCRHTLDNEVVAIRTEAFFQGSG